MDPQHNDHGASTPKSSYKVAVHSDRECSFPIALDARRVARGLVFFQIGSILSGLLPYLF